MPADLSLLESGFRRSIEAVLSACERRGVTMRPYDGVRDPWQQAIYWRQSRSSEEIRRKIADLRNAGASYIAEIIDSVGPRSGRHVTNALPGFGWHQYGEAVDSFWLVEGEANWSSRQKVNGVNGYHVYADEGQNAGLIAGGLWASLKDWPHLQLRSGSPSEHFSIMEIDREMQRRWPPHTRPEPR